MTVSQSNSKSSFDQFACSTAGHRHEGNINHERERLRCKRASWGQLSWLLAAAIHEVFLAGNCSISRAESPSLARARRGRAWPSAARDEQLGWLVLCGGRGSPRFPPRSRPKLARCAFLAGRRRVRPGPQAGQRDVCVCHPPPHTPMAAAPTAKVPTTVAENGKPRADPALFRQSLQELCSLQAGGG